MRIGDYRHIITVKSFTNTVDDRGGVEYSEMTVGTYNCHVKNYTGYQANIEGRDTTGNDFEIELRYDAAIVQGMQVLWEGKKMILKRIDVLTPVSLEKMKLICSLIQ